MLPDDLRVFERMHLAEFPPAKESRVLNAALFLLATALGCVFAAWVALMLNAMPYIVQMLREFW